MKLTVSYNELRSQLEFIGAVFSDWKINSLNLQPRQELLAELSTGIEINLSDINFGPGKLLTYRGEQVILYIKDTGNSIWTLENEPEKSKRFHVAECRTLDEMRSKNRFERYVVTNRMDGLFLVDWLDRITGEKGEMVAALKVCKNCLTSLNWRGYENSQDRMQINGDYPQRKNSIWDNFSIAEFLKEYSTFFKTHPSRRDNMAIVNAYVEDWPRISEKRRRAVNWRCEQCSVNLKNLPGSLHCHHINGVVTDNSTTNLRVLCALCHTNQPGHQHMKVSAAERKKIERLRIP